MMATANSNLNGKTPTGATDATAGPMQPRYDRQGRRLCGAHRTNGEPCRSPAMAGQRVCRMHGGSAPQARKRAQLRLMELIEPSVATLAREMVYARKSADRIRAASAILDRAGIGPGSGKADIEEARALLLERLQAIRDEQIRKAEEQEQAEQAPNAASDGERGTDS